MSNNERPERRAFGDLQVLIHHLVDELAGFRRRALAAEARAREMEQASGDAAQPGLRERLSQLERENRILRERLEAAATRTQSMLNRVHFLRQQVQGEER